MATGLVKILTGIEDQLDAMVKRANLVPGYLNRVVYRQYQNAQRTRWMNENNGEDFEGGTWPRLTVAYQERKFREFYNSPGKGSKMLIASGVLQKSVIGPGEGHVKMVDQTSITISTTVYYGKYVDEARTFTRFSPKFYKRVYTDLKDYLTKNIVRNPL